MKGLSADIVGILAQCALFVVGQILSRQLFLAADENPTLVALGMGRNQLFALGLAEAAIVATAIATRKKVWGCVMTVGSSRTRTIGEVRRVTNATRTGVLRTSESTVAIKSLSLISPSHRLPLLPLEAPIRLLALPAA